MAAGEDGELVEGDAPLARSQGSQSVTSAMAKDMADSQKEFAKALKSFAGAANKKDEVVCVELTSVFRKVDVTMDTLFPESAWPQAAAVRSSICTRRGPVPVCGRSTSWPPQSRNSKRRASRTLLSPST